MSTGTDLKTAAAVLDHYLAAFMDLDTDGILAEYTDDSAIITNTGSFHGLDDIGSFFEGRFEEFAQGNVDVEVDQRTVDGDIAYITWHGETPDNVYEFATDTFVIHDGSIETQTFAAKITPKN
ncbi:YybH family protein [Halorarius litoreus]|uniref:YybH family protein n=1 Tax=Halorarius litoreus TaxID=2962676 RepID=UPI0020CF26AD|nr:nuclear transport factor 2 family protein [Halorarius litoreus]